MTMTPVPTGHFWLYTIALLVVWAIVLSSASPSTPSASAAAVGANALIVKGSEKEREVRHARNCKALCSDCGCLGFYCGEECICECNNDKADTVCIATMQQRAQSMRAPFELLIQGPSSNRFVRNAARSFDQDTQRRRSYSMERNKRSTVLVYRPSAEAARLNAMGAGERVKRSSAPNLEWFSDFASTLVRPAPLGGHAEPRQRPLDEMPATQFKRSADERPWFAENTNLLIRPSPLFKRQSFAARQRDSASNSKESSNDVDDAPASSFDAVKAIPKAIQQTLQNIQESAFSEDFGEALRSKLKEGSEALQNSFAQTSQNLGDARQRQRKDFEDALRGMNFFRPAFEPSAQAAAEVSTTVATPASGSGLHVFPWLKAGLFLRRVKQAIN